MMRGNSKDKSQLNFLWLNESEGYMKIFFFLIIYAGGTFTRLVCGI